MKPKWTRSRSPHGDGLAGSSFNYGFGTHTDWEWLEGLADELTHTKLATLLLPGIGTVEDLKHAHALGSPRFAWRPIAPRPMCPNNTSRPHGSLAWMWPGS